jgi:hypothetical protein
MKVGEFYRLTGSRKDRFLILAPAPSSTGIDAYWAFHTSQMHERCLRADDPRLRKVRPTAGEQHLREKLTEKGRVAS